MPIRLVIQSRSNPIRDGAREHCFEQDMVTIGRAAANDVRLQDIQRVVSSRHAEIRRFNNRCVLIDVGSTNGTVVNEQRVAPGSEYELHRGDRIRIGDFTIDFDFRTPAQDAPVDPAVADEDALHGSLPQQAVPATGYAAHRSNAEKVAYALCGLYAALDNDSGADRETLMFEALRDAVRDLDHKQAISLLDQIERDFPVSEPNQAKQGEVSRLAPAARPDRTASDPHRAGETAYEECVALARKYCRDTDDSLSPESIRVFMQRVDQVLSITISSLADAVKGRRQFGREFEVEPTRMLAWTPNRIKLAEGKQQIGEYLLDPRGGDSDLKAMASDLEAVFRDLALHQAGMVAGFRECLRGLLQQLEPDAIEAEALSSLRLGLLKVSLPLSLLQRAAAWRQFKKKYRQLSEEEVRVFEHILAPHFAKGYMLVQKANDRR